MKKRIVKVLSSPRLESLNKNLEKIQQAEKYLDDEKKKLAKEKAAVRKNISKEKKILQLKGQISRLKR